MVQQFLPVNTANYGDSLLYNMAIYASMSNISLLGDIYYSIIGAE